MGRLGYEGIELGGGRWFNPPVKQILADLKGPGIRVTAVSALQRLLDPDAEKRREAVQENKRRLAKARDLGAAVLVVVPVFGDKRHFTGSSDDNPYLQEDKLLVQALEQLAPTAEKTGVRVVLEPLTHLETYYMNLQGHALRIVEKVGSPAVGILSDFYHMQMEEKDIPAALQACAHRTYYLHMADGKARTEPGSLPFDYRPGFAVLKKKGFRGWITLEGNASGKDVPALLAKSLVYLKRQWSEA